jgi:hypothetical protein
MRVRERHEALRCDKSREQQEAEAAEARKEYERRMQVAAYRPRLREATAEGRADVRDAPPGGDRTPCGTALPTPTSCGAA